MLELAELDEDDQPRSPRDAAEGWFSIPGGSIQRPRDNVQIDDLGPKILVEVWDSEDHRRPSISIRDEGIGQCLSRVPDTLLSLGESNKVGLPYLCGAYGQGGSSTFAFCEYTIIVSRCRPAGSDADRVGWTIVRSYDDVNLKLNTYQYLSTDGTAVPGFDPALLGETAFTYGTYVMHVSLEAGSLASQWSLVGYRYFNNLLFDPVLPYTIYDHRESRPQSRRMFGSRGRLAGVSLDYTNEYVEDLGEDGHLTVRYWVFHESKGDEDPASENAVRPDSYLDSSRSNRTVVVTYNGQRHDAIEKSFVKEKTRLAIVADSLLVQVDCDRLSRSRLKGLFTAPRAGIAAGEHRRDLIEATVINAIQTDDELRELENLRLQARLARADEDNEKRVRKVLDKLIDLSRREEAGSHQRQKGERGRRDRRFRPKDPPSRFRFASESKPLRILAGGRSTIDIVTDAPNNLLTRRRHRARLGLRVDGDDVVSLRSTDLRDGRLGVTVTAATDARSGATCTIVATLEGDGGLYFKTSRKSVIQSPPPPYIGNDPPTTLRISSRGGVVQFRQGSDTRVAVETDCQDDALTRPSDPAVFTVDCEVPGVHMTARRGPRRGVIEAVFRIDDDAPLVEGDSKHLSATLTLTDGTQMTDTLTVLVTQRQVPGAAPRGSAETTVPNYALIDVWREQPEDQPEATVWEDVGWDGSNVGKYEVSNDKLLLFINMDHTPLSAERRRRLRKSGERKARRVETSYQAYIGHHMYLQAQAAGPLRPGATEGPAPDPPPDTTSAPEGNGVSETPPSEAALQDELRRVAKTLLFALTSQADLEALAAGDKTSV